MKFSRVNRCSEGKGASQKDTVAGRGLYSRNAFADSSLSSFAGGNPISEQAR